MQPRAFCGSVAIVSGCVQSHAVSGIGRVCDWDTKDYIIRLHQAVETNQLWLVIEATLRLIFREIVRSDWYCAQIRDRTSSAIELQLEDDVVSSDKSILDALGHRDAYVSLQVQRRLHGATKTFKFSEHGLRSELSR